MPAEIGAMEMGDALDLYEYWRDAPPVHEAVRRIGIGLGIEKRPAVVSDTAPVDPNDPSGIGGLIARFPDGFVKAGG